MQILSEQEDKENLPPLEEETIETLENEEETVNSDGEDIEEVPEENVENLQAAPEEAENATLPQSPEGDSSLEDVAHVNVDAVMAENEALKEEVEKLRKTLQQSGELARESAVAVAMDDGEDVDFSAFVYGGDEERKAASGKLMTRLLNMLRTEAAPIIAQRDEALRTADMAKAIKVLSSMEDDFPGFGGQVEALNALVGSNAILQAHTDPMEQMITAYIMNAGLKAIEKDKTGMSVDELMDLYRKNEEFKTAVEKERIQRLEETGDVPIIPMDGGFSSASPYEAPVPKDLKEAHDLVRKIYKTKG